MSIYFDQTAPLLLASEPGFDAYQVDVDETTALVIIQINELLVEMRQRMYEAGAPEDYAQELATGYVNDVAAIIRGEQSNATSYS